MKVYYIQDPHNIWDTTAIYTSKAEATKEANSVNKTYYDGEEVYVVGFFEVPISKEGILEAFRLGSLISGGGLL
nr:hypothetical protein [uncultured Mediterranean phage uvMED]BAR25732.1 hypothetical protein [uncultured Mediterranean phage uvMED]